MRVEDFIRSVDISLQHQNKMCVEIFRPNSVGPTPSVEILQANTGFDWDHGKILLVPEVPLTTLTKDEVLAIRTSVAIGASWHAYQDHKKLTQRIRELENELSVLKEQMKKPS